MGAWPASCATGTRTWCTGTCRAACRGCWRAAGLTLRRCEVVPLLNVGYDRDTFSGGLVELIASFVAGGAGEAAGEAAPWAAGLRAMGPDYFFSLNRYLFVATR